MTKSECAHVMAPAISSGLNGAGICRKLPTTLHDGPISYQGLKLPHIYTLQGIARLSDLLNHNHIETNTGFLHRACLEQLIVSVGLGPDLLSSPHTLYGHLASFCLMEQNWQFLSENNITLNHDVTMPTRRKGDEFLMQLFVANSLTRPTLQIAQRCMHYLQISTLSDITNGNGSRISNNTLIGHYDNHRPHYYQWPYQQKPPQAEWTTWRRILRQCIHDKKQCLHYCHRQWTDRNEANNLLWFFSATEDRLFQRLPLCWAYWIPNYRRPLRSTN